MKRESNFEMLRIVAMLMIVTLHTVGHGKALSEIDISSTNYFIAVTLKSFTIVAVNCYILISGYFGINSKFKWRKILTLYIQVLFYSLTIFIFAILFLNIKITSDIFLDAILPITRETWWFISIYFVLYLLSPYINKLLKMLDFKEITTLIIIVFCVFIIWPSIPRLKPIDIKAGYSLYVFVYLYIVGAYINIYFKDKFKLKKVWGLIYFLCCSSLIILSKLNLDIFKNKDIYGYNFILVFIASIALFMVFKSISIRSNFINKVASLTLGVYLISDNPIVRGFIYNKLGYSNHFNSKYFIVYTILTVLVIYITTSIIEYFRQIIFNFISNSLKRTK